MLFKSTYNISDPFQLNQLTVYKNRFKLLIGKLSNISWIHHWKEIHHLINILSTLNAVWETSFCSDVILSVIIPLTLFLMVQLGLSPASKKTLAKSRGQRRRNPSSEPVTQKASLIAMELIAIPGPVRDTNIKKTLSTEISISENGDYDMKMKKKKEF